MDIDKSLVLVISEGILSSLYLDEMMQNLLEYIWNLDEAYANVYWNYVSSPILNPPR